jgi:hypothetical protein
MINKVKVYEDQNIVDLAIQEYGSIEGLINLARGNNLAVDADMPTDVLLKVDDTEAKNLTTRLFFKNNKYVVATGREDDDGDDDGIFDDTFDDTFE